MFYEKLFNFIFEVPFRYGRITICDSDNPDNSQVIENAIAFKCSDTEIRIIKNSSDVDTIKFGDKITVIGDEISIEHSNGKGPNISFVK